MCVRLCYQADCSAAEPWVGSRVRARALGVVFGLALVVACGKPAPQQTDHRSKDARGVSEDDDAREQSRYDLERRPDLILAAAGIRVGETVADVGAGSGLLTSHVARAVGATGKVVATDIEQSVLDLLKRRLGRAGVGTQVTTRLVSADAPGLEPNTYDVILLAEVDHYFTDRAAWLTQAQPALTNKGRIVISNRVHHRVGALAAAKKAGLVLKAETTPVPSHYVAVFVAKDRL